MNKIERLLVKEFTSGLTAEEKEFLASYRGTVKTRSKEVAKEEREDEIRLKKVRESEMEDWQSQAVVA